MTLLNISELSDIPPGDIKGVFSCFCDQFARSRFTIYLKKIIFVNGNVSVYADEMLWQYAGKVPDIH